ncbi:MAG: hypothetical protein N2322_02245, partial [Terrimicrobiaceae bacterium]|nr:hypothetical protein [Terrimicrobiaceae bacterium]
MSSPSESRGLLVFAHTPPPYHGQSLMTAHLLDALREGDFPVFHVDARVSRSLRDVGGLRAGKLAGLLRH